METDNLGKRYGRRWALANCTLTVPAGQVVGLVGPNGAGKTTLLQLAVGLLRPTTIIRVIAALHEQIRAFETAERNRLIHEPDTAQAIGNSQHHAMLMSAV